MADSTLDSQAFYLIDRWPGTPWQGADLPTDGFTGTSHHNVTTAAYPVGTKIQVMCTHTSYELGLATLIYLRDTEIVSTDCPVAVKHFVTPNDTSNWYAVTNSASALADLGSPAAVGLSTMSTTTGAYGWFWCGGVCPTQYVTALDGAFATDSTVAAGLAVLSDLAATTTTYGELGLQVLATDVAGLPVAFCLKADA